MRKPIILSALAMAMAVCVPAALAEDHRQVIISPLFADSFSCSQHWEGQLKYQGDALGSDCYVTRLVDTPSGGAFSRAYTGDGLANEDWFSWQQPVLAPFDGDVVRVAENSVVNKPGDLGKPPASMIVVRRDDGVHVLYAHIAQSAVAEGDVIEEGQPLAVVGNNGFGRNPHIHIGAWGEDGPLQIVFDLTAYGRLMEQPEE